MRIKKTLTISTLEKVSWQRVIGNEHGLGVRHSSEGVASTADALLTVVKPLSGFGEWSE